MLMGGVVLALDWAGGLRQSASNEYAASYTPEEATEEGAVDHHRTLKTRVLPAAGGTPESFICTSDLDVRTLASVRPLRRHHRCYFPDYPLPVQGAITHTET